MLAILRHGDAELLSADSQRQLSDYGCQQIALLAKADLSFVDCIWVSPYLRAQQTKDLVIRQSMLNVPVTTKANLLPDSDLNLLQADLYACTSQSLLLIGHNPILSELINLLTGQNTVWLNTGELMLLDGEYRLPGCMQVLSVKHFNND